MSYLSPVYKGVTETKKVPMTCPRSRGYNSRVGMDESVVISTRKTESGTVCSWDFTGQRQPRSAGSSLPPIPGAQPQSDDALQEACRDTGVRTIRLSAYHTSSRETTQSEFDDKSQQRTEKESPLKTSHEAGPLKHLWGRLVCSPTETQFIRGSDRPSQNKSLYVWLVVQWLFSHALLDSGQLMQEHHWAK